MAQSVQPNQSLNEYVQANREQLVEYLIHGSDSFVRALILNAFREAGSPEDFDRLRRMIDEAEERRRAEA